MCRFFYKLIIFNIYVQEIHAMIKYFGFILLFSAMGYAAQKNGVETFSISHSQTHQQLLTHLCSQIVMQWEDWNKTGKPSWELKKEIGDQKHVKALLELPHMGGEKSDKIEKSNCNWVRHTHYLTINGNPNVEVEDVLHVSKVKAENGTFPTVGRHIWMKRPYTEEKGLLGGPKYCVSAQSDSKTISWSYINGMFMI